MQALLADTSQIRQDLEYMTRRWHELDVPAVFEVRCFKEGAPQPKTFKYAPDWIDEAVETIEEMNALGYNCYVVRNPIRADIAGSAKDEDIIAAFFLWADCDDGDAADNVKRFDGPKCSASIVTGRQPSVRAHIYWELAEPCTDLAKWREMQVSISRHFGSDGSVINPSRIMRIAGTVAYPAKHKVERGYQKELSRHKIYDRAAVTMDQMQRAFGASQPASTPEKTLENFDQFETLDRERTRIQALSGQEWHNAVVRLVASYVSKGLSDDEIHSLTAPLTLAGYTVQQTRAEVQTAIDGARAKGWTPGKPPEPVAATPQTISDFRIDDSDGFLADLRPLEYLIDGVLPTGVVYSLTGYAGHGKTTLALQFALSVAQGEDFCGRESTQGDVLILAGENPYNLKWQYAAALAARGIKSANIKFVQGHFSLDQWTDVLKAKLDAMPTIKLIIVDSLQAFFEGDSDNDNTQMVEMARKFRRIGDIASRPAMLIIAHPAGKTPSKDMLVPRGGGGFLNEIDGNLTVWCGDAAQQTLHHSQKFRGAGFDPMEWIMQIHEFEHLTDAKGVPLKLPVSRPEMVSERAHREQTNDRLLVHYLHTVDAGQPLSVRELASQERISRYRAQQIITTAKEEKLIKRYAKTYVLTDGGKAFLEAENE